MMGGKFTTAKFEWKHGREASLQTGLIML